MSERDLSEFKIFSPGAAQSKIIFPDFQGTQISTNGVFYYNKLNKGLSDSILVR